MRRTGQQGFAIAIALLAAAVVLGIAVTSASLASLAARQVAGNERAATEALLAAESGLNTVLARSGTAPYAYDDASHSSVGDWLESVGLASYGLPGGATVAIEAVGQAGGVVTLKATGSAGGSTRTILQDFALDSLALDPGLFADAALLTKEALKSNSAKSRLMGRGLSVEEWRFPNRLLYDAREGEYVEIGAAVYRVENVQEDGTADLIKVQGGGGDMLGVAGSTPVTLLPFAFAGPSSPNPTTMSVTDATLYKPGTEIHIGSGIATVTAQGNKTIDVSWKVSPGSISEGTPIRRKVPSAIAEGGCPTKDLDTKMPHGCEVQDLGNLFANTFGGMSKTDLRDLFISEGDYYSNGAWPALVDGLVWIDGAKTRGKNNELCGSGIVVLNTGSSLEDDASFINLTTADCDFKGILYVIGQLKLVGNLDNLSGAVITEGPGTTEVQGTGDKSLYDPIAVRDALDLLPPVIIDKGLLAALPNTVRFER